jgi:uncharacterized membrane protein HdeD (DUF308 family)
MVHLATRRLSAPSSPLDVTAHCRTIPQCGNRRLCGVFVPISTASRNAMIANILSTYWWTMLLRGIVWILLGLAVFAKPGLSLVVLTLYVGAVFLIDGISTIVGAIAGRKEQEHWVLLLLIGLAGIFVGLATFANPAITSVALLFYVAVWAIATGLLEIAAAIRLRREISGEWWLVGAGVLSLAFGVLIMAHPGAGLLGILWAIAAFALCFGVMLVVLAFRARSFGSHLDHHGPMPHAPGG